MRSRAEPEWLAVHEDDGEVRFRVGRIGEDVIAEWSGLARLTASRDGQRSELVFSDAASDAEIRKLERGAAHLLMRQLRGKMALHGSAVAFGSSAVVFLAGSGHGKSTLAGALCNAGAALVADDAVAIDVVEGKPVVLPTDTEHWLDTPAREELAMSGAPIRREKAAIPARIVPQEPLSVAAIVTLEWEAGTSRGSSLVRVERTDALARLLPHVIRFVLDDPTLVRRELDELHRIIEEVPVHVFERPRAFAELPRAVDILSALCLKGGEVLR